MGLSKHEDSKPLSNNDDAVQYPHGGDKSFAGNDEKELLNDEDIQQGKEKYLGDVANIEDVRGNGGEPVEEQSPDLNTNSSSPHGTPDVERLKADLDDAEPRGL